MNLGMSFIGMKFLNDQAADYSFLPLGEVKPGGLVWLFGSINKGWTSWSQQQVCGSS
jgi:hypothetical protein